MLTQGENMPPGAQNAGMTGCSGYRRGLNVDVPMREKRSENHQKTVIRNTECDVSSGLE